MCVCVLSRNRKVGPGMEEQGSMLIVALVAGTEHQITLSFHDAKGNVMRCIFHIIRKKELPTSIFPQSYGIFLASNPKGDFMWYI